MKQIIERVEIGKALNMGKYPVIDLDIAKEENLVIMQEQVVGFKAKVRVAYQWQGSTHYDHSQFHWFGDSKRITFGNIGSMLSASFGYQDIEKMVSYANAPIINKNEEFVLVMRNSVSRKAVVLLSKTADHLDICSQTQLFVEERIDLMKYYEVLI